MRYQNCIQHLASLSRCFFQRHGEQGKQIKIRISVYSIGVKSLPLYDMINLPQGAWLSPSAKLVTLLAHQATVMAVSTISLANGKSMSLSPFYL